MTINLETEIVGSRIGPDGEMCYTIQRGTKRWTVSVSRVALDAHKGNRVARRNFLANALEVAISQRDPDTPRRVVAELHYVMPQAQNAVAPMPVGQPQIVQNSAPLGTPMVVNSPTTVVQAGPGELTPEMKNAIRTLAGGEGF